MDNAFDTAKWVEALRQGDEEAARELLRHLYPLVLKLVRAHLPRRTSEEDLIQTVFMKVFSKIEQFSGSVPLEHWVSRITINTCLKQVAHEKVRPELRMADLSEEEERIVQSIAASDNDLPASQNVASRELVEKLLECLSGEDRLVIHLIHLDQKSVREAALITGWSVPLVKVRAFRARQKLRKQLEKLSKEETT